MAWMIQAEEFGNSGGSKETGLGSTQHIVWSNDLQFKTTPESLTKKLLYSLGKRGSPFKPKIKELIKKLI